MLFTKLLSLLLTITLVSGGTGNIPNIKNDKALQSDVQKDIEAFEKENNREVQLPKDLPFRPTKIESSYNKTSNSLRITYYEDKNTIHIDIDNLDKIKSKPLPKNGTHTKLSDGTEARYFNGKESAAEILIFYKSGLIYGIGFIKQNGTLIGLEKLRTIANSLE
ncbi:hypothetical protein [Paenibacillus turpanensis]|uniref:hypothetical protein n=1 Tax=Paenibacillus turpanensis TaxID=2689078 RepID=UPI001A9CE0D4|nr:hypothetical protein [Paenibacillus turpanensis]